MQSLLWLPLGKQKGDMVSRLRTSISVVQRVSIDLLETLFQLTCNITLDRWDMQHHFGSLTMNWTRDRTIYFTRRNGTEKTLLIMAMSTPNNQLLCAVLVVVDTSLIRATQADSEPVAAAITTSV